MIETTHSDFGQDTEGVEVAQAFAGQVQGKTIIVTGVNRGGVGFSTARAVASQSPAHLIITGRSSLKLQEGIKALKEEFPNVDYRVLEFNLSSQKSVRAAASELLSWTDVPEVNVLVNNAATAMLPERTLSEDGIEMHFATNHIGHYLFTCLIMPKLFKAAANNPKGATRVVNVSSASPKWAKMRWGDLNFEKKNKDLAEQDKPNLEVLKAWGYPNPEEMSYVPLEGYNQSKVANLLFTIAANRRLYEKHGILFVTVHPGVIHTELGRFIPPDVRNAIGKIMEARQAKYKALEAASSTSLVAALDPKLAPGKTEDGKDNFCLFLEDCQFTNALHPRAMSSEEAERLWSLSEELVKEKFAW